ncbi:hypothetical protein BDR26DRAFT_936595 [Obelidium mucronatum]|nr:hypothetical protein BDR26DRAFT_936595 [Obelidium mucronatum]
MDWVPFVERMLILQRDVTGVPGHKHHRDSSPELSKKSLEPSSETEVNDAQKGEKKSRTEDGSVADILTILSQIILVLSTSALAFSLVYPETASRILESYKDKITARRHKNMLEFMATSRDCTHGDMRLFFTKNKTKPNKDSLMFADQVYHDEVAQDARQMLLQAPILRFGIVTGPAGSGKTRLMRTLAHEQPYYGFLSFGLTSSAQSIVDELGEEIGYDFDDWTERLISGVLFQTGSTSFNSNLDKLSFLLDEFEEACWTLKFDKSKLEEGSDSTTAAANTTTSAAGGGKRPLLVLDDLDSLDFKDEEVAKTVKMLFNAANKFAREDTAVIVFTMSDILLDELCTRGIIRTDIMTAAQVYRVGNLTEANATRFLEDRLGVGSVASKNDAAAAAAAATVGDQESTLLKEARKKDIDRIKAVMGTKIFDLMRVSEELVKKEGDLRENVEQVLQRELRAAEDTVVHTLAIVSDLIGERKLGGVLQLMDQLSTFDAKEEEYRHKHQIRENGWSFSDVGGRGGRVWEEARKKGLELAWKTLREHEVLGSDGYFISELIRNGYRQHRQLPQLVFTESAIPKKSNMWRLW